MADQPDDRLFTLCSYDYMTGVCSDGRQIVMGLLCPELVAYFFDAEGNLLGDERRPWNKPARRIKNDGPYITGDKDFESALAAQWQEWRSSIGFEPRTIHIRAFWDNQHHVGIELVPEHLRNLETYWADDEGERLLYMASRDEWLADGKFVWWWGRDYWIDRDGEVEST